MTKARDLANIISGGLTADDIPALPTSKITSGTFADARLSSSSVTQHVDLTALSASNLTSGTVPSARLSLSASDVPDLATSKITSGTFADARISSSSVTAHVDLTALSASNLTSGTIPDARFPATLPAVSGANLTSMSVASTVGTWTPSLENGTTNDVTAKYVKVGKMVHCRCSFYLSGSASSQSDTTLRLAGLPFTSASSHTYAGGGYSIGNSSTNYAFVSVESAATTAIFQFNTKDPDTIVWSGSRARRHSYTDSSDSYYSIFVTYATAS